MKINPTKCKDCNQSIIFALSEDDKWVPVDLTLTPIVVLENAPTKEFKGRNCIVFDKNKMVPHNKFCSGGLKNKTPLKSKLANPEKEIVEPSTGSELRYKVEFKNGETIYFKYGSIEELEKYYQDDTRGLKSVKKVWV